MHTEVLLVDGTTLNTEDNVNTDDLIRRIGAAGRPDHASVGFVAIHTRDGQTLRVNPLQIVYMRDIA